MVEIDSTRPQKKTPFSKAPMNYTRKLGLFRPPELLAAPTTKSIIDESFPVHPPRRARTIDVAVDAIFSIH